MRRRFLCQILAVLIVISALAVGSQTSLSTITFVQQITPAPPSPDSSPAPSTTPIPLSQLEREVIELRERVNGLSSLLNIALVLFGLFFAVSAGVSTYGFFRAESRAKESHALSVAGETAAQSRASEVHGTFLDSSKQTLELVNATLQLAKDSSERAVKSVETNAISARERLDQEAKELLSRVPEEDDSALVANQERRSELISLAHKVAGFEINQLILPTPIALTPPCLFVRGMELHLRQQFEDALKYWREVALRDDTAGSLKSLAWYWIGIEQNNLARFSEAEQSFRLAGETASGARNLELQRIRLESRFCNKEEVQASALIRPLRELLNKAKEMDPTQQVEARNVKIMITLGNVIHQAGNDCRRDGRVDEATAYYEAALAVFEETDSRDKWALFGRTEALYRLARFHETYPICHGTLRNHAVAEYFGRIEPRTKVLGRTMELICCVRVPDLWNDVTVAYRNTIEALGEVDDRLTIYSQLQRRNVRQSEFRDELDQLVHETQTSGKSAGGR